MGYVVPGADPNTNANSDMNADMGENLYPPTRAVIMSPKRIEARRKCKGMRTTSVVLIVFGAFLLFPTGALDPSMLITGLCFVAGGCGILVARRSKIRRWDSYEALINFSGNTPLAYFVEHLRKGQGAVRSDLSSMISKGFLTSPDGSVSPYIDKQYKMLVMTRNGRPLEPIADTLQQEISVKETKAEVANLSDNVRRLRQAISAITDEEVLSALYDIEGSVRRIEKSVKEDSALKENPDIKKLYSFYLPETIELADKFRTGDVSYDTEAALKDILRVCANAFENIEDKIRENDDLDTLADIEALRSAFARGGLLESDFVIKQ